MRVRLAGRFDIYFNPEVSGGAIVIQDTFVDTRFATALRLRLGKAKTPFGLEVLHSASGLLFLERALPSVLAPNRDIGIQVLGDLAGGAVSYSAALLNGTADGGSVDTDINDGKDVAGRLLVKPFAGLAGSPLTGLSLAVAGTTGRQAGSGALSSLRTPTGRQVFFT